MNIDNIIQFILNPNPTGLFLFIKIIFLITNLFFIAFIVFAFFTTSWFKRLIVRDMKEYLTYRHYGLVKIEKKWAEIKERLEEGREPEAKLSVIEADNLLNETLKAMGYAGKSLSEKLDKLTTDILSNINEVKRAHKVRSDIIHDPSYRLDIKESKRTLKAFEKALVDLQAL